MATTFYFRDKETEMQRNSQSPMRGRVGINVRLLNTYLFFFFLTDITGFLFTTDSSDWECLVGKEENKAVETLGGPHNWQGREKRWGGVSFTRG